MEHGSAWTSNDGWLQGRRERIRWIDVNFAQNFEIFLFYRFSNENNDDIMTEDRRRRNERR